MPCGDLLMLMTHNFWEMRSSEMSFLFGTAGSSRWVQGRHVGEVWRCLEWRVQYSEKCLKEPPTKKASIALSILNMVKHLLHVWSVDRHLDGTRVPSHRYPGPNPVVSPIHISQNYPKCWAVTQSSLGRSQFFVDWVDVIRAVVSQIIVRCVTNAKWFIQPQLGPAIRFYNFYCDLSFVSLSFITNFKLSFFCRATNRCV